MGVAVPLLNERKRSFVFNRIPQTVLGGLKVRLGYDAPLYVYINQIVLWLVPFLLGCLFTLVLELMYTNEQKSNFLMLYSCLCGAMVTIFVVIAQTVSTVVEMKEKEAIHVSIRRKKNSLLDEDQVDFESCCGAETFAFVIPAKRFKINIALHALVSGAVCGLGYWYLLPFTLNSLFGHSYGATVVIYILGWFTICVAQYSLTATAPPEPAVYRTMDTYEIQPFTRPLYALICYSIHIAEWYSSDFHVANQALHIVFVLLPILWFLGLLPPGDILLLWILEQCQVFLYGGSPAASVPRLLANVVFSTGVFFGCYMLSSCFGSAVLAAGMGYLLSCDLGALGNQMWSSCHKNSRTRISSSKQKNTAPATLHYPHINGFLWSWCWSTFYYHGVMTTVAAVAAAVVNYHSGSIPSVVVEYLGYSIIAACIVEKLVRDFQGVFVFFGLWRNILYPHSTRNVAEFRKKQKRLLVLGVVRRVLVNWVCPVTMVVYLSLQVTTLDVMSASCVDGMPTVQSVFFTFGLVRAYRWVWQSTTHAVLEMAVVHIILIMLPENPTVLHLGVLILQLIISVVRDRFYQIMNKLYYVFALTAASWTYKKQRRSSTGGIIVLNVIFSPLVLAVIITASVISAPVLCLFTLPLFFIGFPRPCKFWPESVGASASICPDTLYYRQLSNALTRALRSAFANGSLGEPQAGNHYLMRFQDRLVWVMILERGASYCTVSIKGLELQETSCHTTEAAEFDDQFQKAFEDENGSCGACSFNTFPLHCLTPVDAAVLRTYSDARNVLTGVIDSEESVEITLSFFAKSLIWVLLHHINKLKQREGKARQLKEKEIALMEKANSGDSTTNRSLKDGRWKDKTSAERSNTKLRELGHNARVFDRKYDHTDSVSQNKHTTNVPCLGSNSNSGLATVNVDWSNPNHGSRPESSLSLSLSSFTDTIWADCERDKSKPKSDFSKQKNKISTVVSITATSLDKQVSHHSGLASLDRQVSHHSGLASLDRQVSHHSGLASLDRQVSHHSGLASLDRQVSHHSGLSSLDRQVSHHSGLSSLDRQVSHHSGLASLDRQVSHHSGLSSLDRQVSHHSELACLPSVVTSGEMPSGTFRNSENVKDVDSVFSDVELGYPAVDVCVSCSQLDPSFDEASQNPDCVEGSRTSIHTNKSSFMVTNGNRIYKPSINLAGSPDFKCPFSSHISVPVKWRELPLEPSHLSGYISKFPVSWYMHTLHTLNWSCTGQPGEEVAAEVATDDALTNCYSQLIMACCSAFDIPGRPSGASYLYKCYNGDIPWNAMIDWLSEDKELYNLVIKAFRYGFKLMLDQTLLGGIDSDKEVEEALISYDRDWYIGRESNADWGVAVMEGRGHLFSVGQNMTQGTYTSRSLTLQDVVVHIGRVNCENVVGQWSNLNLELLYMTNDDEERYSIQAQPATLRNLTVQVADPPLGYPIYSSPPISVPTL